LRVQIAVLAQTVSVDRFTNRVSIFNLIDAIESPRFPLFIPELAFFALLRKESNDPEQFKVRVSISVGPSIIGSTEVQVDFQGSQNARILLNFQGLPVTEPKDLHIAVSLPNQQHFASDVMVIQSGQATGSLPFQTEEAKKNS